MPLSLPTHHFLRLLAILVTAGTPALTARAADAPRPLQPEDVTLLRPVGDPQLSPDGTLVAYTVGTTDLAKDKGAVTSG